MTSVGVESILHKNQLTEEDVTNYVEEIATFDKRILASYKQANKNWKSLNLFTVKRIIELYNKSSINIKTGKILDFYREKIHVFKNNDVLKASLLVKYVTSVEKLYDVKLFAITRNYAGNFRVCFRIGSLYGIDFMVNDYKDYWDLQEQVTVDFSKIDDDICNIVFFMYVSDKTGPKHIFSSVEFLLGDTHSSSKFEFYREANSSFGALGFEITKEKDGWNAYLLGDAIDLCLQELVENC